MKKLHHCANLQEMRAEVCASNKVAVYKVGECYDHDSSGKPIPEADRGKWFVAAAPEAYPDSVLKAIPLAETEAEALENAVRHLGLQDLCPVCNEAVIRHPIKATPLWQMVILSVVLMGFVLAGAMQMDGQFHMGFHMSGPVYVFISAMAALAVVSMLLPRKDSSGFHCRHCGYSE